MSYQKYLTVSPVFCSGGYFLLDLGMNVHREYLSVANTLFCQVATCRNVLNNRPCILMVNVIHISCE